MKMSQRPEFPHRFVLVQVTVKSRAVDRSTIQFSTIFGVLLTETCYYSIVLFVRLLCFLQHQVIVMSCQIEFLALDCWTWQQQHVSVSSTSQLVAPQKQSKIEQQTGLLLATLRYIISQNIASFHERFEFLRRKILALQIKIS